jgi:hypothetical protein
MQEIWRLQVDLHLGLNTPPLENEFEELFNIWDHRNNSDALYDLYPRSKQKAMLQTMVHQQHTSSDSFFRVHLENDILTILELHSIHRIRCAYPNNRYMDLPMQDHVVVLPIFCQGDSRRANCYQYLRRNPDYHLLANITDPEMFHLFLLAIYIIFDLEDHEVTLDDYARTLGFTVTPAHILSLQQQYILRCQETTKAFRKKHHLSCSSQTSQDSFELSFQDPDSLSQRSKSSSQHTEPSQVKATRPQVTSAQQTSKGPPRVVTLPPGYSSPTFTPEAQAPHDQNMEDISHAHQRQHTPLPQEVAIGDEDMSEPSQSELDRTMDESLNSQPHRPVIKTEPYQFGDQYTMLSVRQYRKNLEESKDFTDKQAQQRSIIHEVFQQYYTRFKGKDTIPS